MADGDLLSILAMVEMDHIVDREGGWDAARDWRDALSGGQNRRSLGLDYFITIRR